MSTATRALTGAATAAPAGPSCPAWCVRHDDGAHRAAAVEIPLSLHALDVAPLPALAVEMSQHPAAREATPLVCLDLGDAFAMLTLDEADRLAAAIVAATRRGRTIGRAA